MYFQTSKNSNTGFQTALLDFPQKMQKYQLENKMMPLSSADRTTPPQNVDPVIFTSSFVPQLPRLPVKIESHLPTIFGRVPEKCVTFCIDTSGSMFYALDLVKEHLIETLCMMAEQNDSCLFNMIEFNTDVTKWSNKMVHCTPETVAAAKQWVHNLAVKAGTNTQKALLTACQAVYLVTDDIPDNYSEEVVSKILDVCSKCHLHCIYISAENINEDAVEFLEDLAVGTCGSIHIVKLTFHGCVERISPIYRSDHSRVKFVQALKNTLQSSLKACSVATTLQFDPENMSGLSPYPKSSIYHPLVSLNTLPGYLGPYYWSGMHSRDVLLENRILRNPLLNFQSTAGSLLAGKRVLARRKQDGYFYRATVKNQVSGDKFLVVFPPCRHYNLYQTEYEDVFVYDIIDCTTTQNRTITTGDRVLAPWDVDQDRFAPGTVVTAQSRQKEPCFAKFTVEVCFKDGQVRRVPEEAVVLIPPGVYDKLKQEKQTSLTSNTHHQTVDYKTDSIKYHRISPLTRKFSTFPWDSVLSGQPSFLTKSLEYTQSVINKTNKKELAQGMRKEIPYSLTLPLRNDVINMKDQDEMQEYPPGYEENHKMRLIMTSN